LCSRKASLHLGLLIAACKQAVRAAHRNPIVAKRSSAAPSTRTDSQRSGISPLESPHNLLPICPYLSGIGSKSVHGRMVQTGSSTASGSDRVEAERSAGRQRLVRKGEDWATSEVRFLVLPK
jgi:hypothetical protein